MSVSTARSQPSSARKSGVGDDRTKARPVASEMNVVRIKKMERAKGIEPSCAVWKTAVLPLNYARSSAPQSSRARSLVNATADAVPAEEHDPGMCRNWLEHRQVERLSSLGLVDVPSRHRRLRYCLAV